MLSEDRDFVNGFQARIGGEGSRFTKLFVPADHTSVGSTATHSNLIAKKSGS